MFRKARHIIRGALNNCRATEMAICCVEVVTTPFIRAFIQRSLTRCSRKYLVFSYFKKWAIANT